MGYYLKDKEILIYGAGGSGKIVLNILKENKCKIAGFIDRRAKNMGKVCEYQVFDLCDIENFSNKDEYVIILTFKNLYGHDDIVKKFYKKGYNNIIFKPLTVLHGTCENNILEEISSVHEMILDKHVFPHKEISSIRGVELDVFRDSGKIEEVGQDVIANISVELIFNHYEPESSPWSYVNFLASYPAIDMYTDFRQCDGNYYGKGISEYIEKVAKYFADQRGYIYDEEWTQQVIEGRAAVYREMKRKKSLDFGFFIKHCISVNEYEGKKFILSSSGKNRLCFLIAEGFQYVPVRMSKISYERFLNTTHAKELISYIRDKDITQVVAPIPHPYFYNMKALMGDYTEKWLMRIGKILSRIIYESDKTLDFERYKIIDMAFDQGTSYRLFKAMGFEVVLGEEQDELTELINKLLYYNVTEKNNIEDREGEILLLSDRVYGDYSKDILWSSVNYIFFQSWGNGDLLDVIENKGFKSFGCFFRANYDSKLVGGYFFAKNISNNLFDKCLIDLF